MTTEEVESPNMKYGNLRLNQDLDHLNLTNKDSFEGSFQQQMAFRQESQEHLRNSPNHTKSMYKINRHASQPDSIGTFNLVNRVYDSNNFFIQENVIDQYEDEFYQDDGQDVQQLS